MNPTNHRSRFARLAPILIGLSACGCGPGDKGANGGSDFLIAAINVAPNSVWRINRPITIQFTEAVEFSSVNLNSVQIRQPSGTPAIGEFTQVDATTISFQPFCPRRPDWSDAGLLPGGLQYDLLLLGGSPYSVRSAGGALLGASELRSFVTPNTLDPSELFYDTVVGPPIPVVRSEASVALDASCVEIGGDPQARIYFERASSGAVGLENGFQLPHNLLSDAATHVAFLIAFNQPVDSSSSNIVASRLRLEYLDPTGTWHPLNSRLTLEENCTGSGGRVRIEPQGALPTGAQLRVFQAPDFRDIIGETSAVSQTEFAPALTALATAILRDSLEEEFTFGGDGPDSHEDVSPDLGLPLAEWGGGSLSSVIGFTGSGGVDGEFDWEVSAGEVFIFDTTTSILVGGPGFLHTTQQVVVGGVIDLRNFRVAQGGILRFQGPNPVKILASGFVQIDGTIDAGGVDGRSVSGIFFPPGSASEVGAPGVAGGGMGGTGSPNTSAPSPKGTDGQGAFGVADAGGGGGETTFWSGGFNNVDARRGTGGGGARLGSDQLAASGFADQTFIGLDAEPGFTNLFVPGVGQPPPLGAISGQAPPRGGPVGPSPFSDQDPSNDFFGTSFDASTATVKAGELPRPWAGGGGGGGGNACAGNGGSFPPPFAPFANERGAGGGGGGGSIEILALGNISFGPVGSLKVRGGSGGGGQNSNFLNRVGGGSGGGSGGHVVLQSGSIIDFSSVVNPGQISIIATGGQGGAGKDNLGGAVTGPTGGQETSPILDACPAGFPTSQCLGPISGAGGDGGPGIIQLHTPAGLGGGDIRLPPARTLADLCKPKPVFASATLRMLPTFGKRSIARSVWIPIGAGGFDPDAIAAPFFKPAVFDFGDIDPATGEVRATNGIVDLGPTILGPVTVAAAPLLPFITSSGRTLVLDASPLIGGGCEYFLHHSNLLKRSTLLLSQLGMPGNNVRFDVVAAHYQPMSQPPTLEVTVSSAGPPLSSFGLPGTVDVELIPTYLRINTNGVEGSLPASAAVYVKFQAAPAMGSLPDEAHAVPPMPGSDVSVINASASAGADFRYLRFQIEFDVDRLLTGLSITSPRPALDFLRLPFHY